MNLKEYIKHMKSICKQGILRHKNVILDETFQKELLEIIKCYEQLQQENQKYKEVIDKVSSQIKLYGKYNGEKCTRGFSVMTADFNKLLDILKEVE